jgi:tRNA 2-thiouridine synthesizing protein A
VSTIIQLDCFGLLCPMPIIATAKKMKELKLGDVLEIRATDEGIKTDMPAWCKATGQEYVGVEEKDGEYLVYVKKIVP